MFSRTKLKMFGIILMASFIMSSSFLLPKGAQAASLPLPVSTWLWNTDDIAVKPDSILAFLEQNQVKDVYLQVNQGLPNNVYQNFIGKAYEKGIRVHALDGSPDWVSPDGSRIMDNFFKWVQSYQQSSLSRQKFSGIHLDIEPYLYRGWDSQYKKTVLAYQQIVQTSLVRSRQLNLPLGVDIPFWFDEKQYSNSFGKGSLAAWVIRTTDYATIMAYRDKADGANGINEIIKNEIQLAQGLQKKAIIGVETGRSEEAGFVSFYEEGQSYMAGQLGLVAAKYKSFSSAGGFAIHYLDSWMNMKP